MSAESPSILEDPTNYISQYSEKTKYSCTLLGIMKVVIVGLLVATSAILFEAVKPVMQTAGVLDTDMFPDLKFNFFITAGFILFIVVLGIVVVRL